MGQSCMVGATLAVALAPRSSSQIVQKQPGHLKLLKNPGTMSAISLLSKDTFTRAVNEELFHSTSQTRRSRGN
jgi:hypothetical protein